MFENVEMAPPDPILGLSAAFKKDANPEKINLGVGVYVNEEGVTPIFSAVKKAEERLLKEQITKGYLPIEGSPEYGQAVRKLAFGADHEIVTSGRAATLHAPGGTGALRIAGDFLKAMCPGAAMWVSDPTWANHNGIFGNAGLEIKTYPYYDAATRSLDFDAMIGALEKVPEGDVVLLHGCCHNPTGMDPDEAQWARIADVLSARGIVALLDFAYQGFGRGLEQDATGLRALARPGCELLVASSFSKNFGLYRERVGALTIVCKDAGGAERCLSNARLVVRRNYSNPPAHGAEIVTTILGDADLRREWEEELNATSGRIREMRQLFVDTLKAKGVVRDFSFIVDQTGMFSFSGLTKDQVGALRDKYAIYIVGSGRINVAGMSRKNMDRLCEAIADVLS